MRFHSVDQGSLVVAGFTGHVHREKMCSKTFYSSTPLCVVMCSKMAQEGSGVLEYEEATTVVRRVVCIQVVSLLYTGTAVRGTQG